jgi:hypothetical protein
VDQVKFLKVEERWDSFPPTEEDYKRLMRYERNRLLYRSEHKAIYTRRVAGLLENEDPMDVLYSVVNFCKLLSDKTADNLFGEDSSMRSATQNEAVDAAIEAIWNRSRLSIEEWEGCVQGSYCGDSVIRVRYNGLEDGDEKGCYIEAVPPSHYFVEFDSANMRRAAACCLAYVIDQENGTGTVDQILHKEIHKKGTWKKEIWQLNGSAPSTLISDTGWQDTYYPEGILVWHIPNQKADDYWGIDDYEGIITLQDSLNNAMSRLERVLDKYSDPILAAPENERENEYNPYDMARKVTNFLEMSPDMWDSLNYALGNADKRMRRLKDMRYFEGDPEKLQHVPRYLEWSADLTSRLAQIKQIIESMMMVTETNPTVLGLETTSGVESGWALSIKMAGFKSKIRRRQQNWHYALQEAMYAALAIENRLMGGPAPEKPDILWSSGVPINETEEIDNAIKMKTAGIASLETAIRKAQPDLSDEGVVAEVERIKGEKEEAIQRMAEIAGGSDEEGGEGDAGEE